ncbi:hypothetical protein WN944_005761 [Citrus x changshan-huyou]|uniref:Uncharacterized protein n=1 Tax=Citrus x changshan-huyou TaxID=2935761 RepID=A0AAP0MHY4_9ROSI
MAPVKTKGSFNASSSSCLFDYLFTPAAAQVTSSSSQQQSDGSSSSGDEIPAVKVVKIPIFPKALSLWDNQLLNIDLDIRTNPDEESGVRIPSFKIAL